MLAACFYHHFRGRSMIRFGFLLKRGKPEAREAVEGDEARVGGHPIRRDVAGDDPRDVVEPLEPMRHRFAVLVRRRPVRRQPQVVGVDGLVLDAVRLLAEQARKSAEEARQAVEEQRSIAEEMEATRLRIQSVIDSLPEGARPRKARE